VSPESAAGRSAAFRGCYEDFLVRDGASRILLTGHSHQAWPRAARDGMLACYEDACRHVDDKWQRVVDVGDDVRRRVLVRLGFDETDALAFGKSTHELVFRLLGCLRAGSRVVTTTGEFHSLYRQLARLEEDGLGVDWIDVSPRETLAERLRSATTASTGLVAVSAVLFEDASIVGELESVLERASEVGALALVDAYHAFNVVPLGPANRLGPEWGDAFVTAGGYKYGQMGEGVCFMRVPASASRLRPTYTGWFADFASLERPRSRAREARRVEYGEGGARFAGATFDPVSLYRARAVLEHFDRFGLDVPALRAISVAQTERLTATFQRGGLRILSPLSSAARGGFVALRSPTAHAAVRALRARGVFVDARGEVLRAGPAPYLLDDEIDAGASAIVEALRS
jgi:kynureninase